MGSSIAVVGACRKGACREGACRKGACYKEGSISGRAGIGASSRALSIGYSGGVGE